MLFSIEAIIVLLFLLIFGFISLSKKLLDFNGVLLGIVVGVITFVLGGFNSFVAIALFFLIAEFVTVFSRKLNNKSKIHEVRTIENILANSGAALIALALMPSSTNIAFFAAIAAAFSDTLSGEIGMISKSKPRLITNPFVTVEKGTDGGVSILGLSAGLASAALIGLFYYFITSDLKLFFFVTLAGFFGSIFDSLLGALFERKSMLNNASVNFLASSASALLAFGLKMLF
ncbi:MAG: DUF92 domain-containing protein [Candidatus Diapherotrites archaeon]|nr:DUF92 domain-containing protein [Candidatus Diapherotrites archaeon]